MHHQFLQVMIKSDCKMIIFIQIVELMCSLMWLLDCFLKVLKDFETRKIFCVSWTDLKSCTRDFTIQLINILTANVTKCDLDTMYVYMMNEMSTYDSTSWIIFLKQWFLYDWWWKKELIENWVWIFEFFV